MILFLKKSDNFKNTKTQIIETNKGEITMTKYYAYHRTSTIDQHLDRGIIEIENYCKNNNIKLEKIYTDQQTGKNFNRPRYTVIIITELDRLGRNKRETMKEIQYYKEHNIRLMVLELPTTLMDFETMNNDMARMMLETINNMMLELYASMAQAEIEKKEKRQREGIQAKKLRGEWDDYGRPRAMDFDVFCREYKRVVNGETRPFELMHELNLTRPTFYRYKKQYEALIV